MSLSAESQDAYIRKRLEVDERPLKKLAKRLVQLAKCSDPKDVTDTDAESLQNDFINYEHSVQRLALLIKSNAHEVETYEAKRASIQETHELAQVEIVRLRQLLVRERQAKADRATFDEVASDIRDSALESRRTQEISIAKLQEEIAELESEKANYGVTWELRKSGFEDIMSRLKLLQRDISGEKADADLRAAAEISDDEEGVLDPQNEPALKQTESVQAPGTQSDDTSKKITSDETSQRDVVDVEMMDTT